MHRREFLKTTAFGLLSLPVLEQLAQASPASSDRTSRANGSVTIDVSKLASDGSWMVDSSATPQGKPLLIIRKGAETFVALSMRCTHKGCKVDPPEQGEIECPCHGSVYDLNGKVKDGPAPAPLESYKVTFNAAAKSITVEY